MAATDKLHDIELTLTRNPVDSTYGDLEAEAKEIQGASIARVQEALKGIHSVILDVFEE